MKWPDDFINKIIHADCMDILKEIPDKAVDLVLTDPPYGLGNRMRGGTWGKLKKEMIKWDPPNNKKCWELVKLSIQKSNNQIIWGGNYFQYPVSRGWLAWIKPDALSTMSDFELAWTSFDMVSKLFRYHVGAYRAERVDHPTQKPVALFEWCLYKYSKPDDLILDPFAGSGTTALACHRLGRRFICIEKEKKYIDIAQRRLEEAQAQQELLK